MLTHPQNQPTRSPMSKARTRSGALAAGVACVMGLAACGDEGGGTTAAGEELTTVNIVAFQPPSLGAFLPAVIDEKDFDAEHGLDMQFTYATPDNYNSEFGAGHHDVGASAALLSEALRTERGAEVTYLFNLFDFFGTVVTSDPEIQELPDLEGHTLAAATGTTNYAMFQWFADRQGVDLSKVETLNQTTAGLSTMAVTGRTDATQLWEPAYSTLIAEHPDIRTVPIGIEAWEEEFGTADIPYLGVAAQLEWANDNPELVEAMYESYKAAGDWVMENPEEAAQIIAATIPEGSPEVIQELIENNDERLRMNVTPASTVADGINAVFEAGTQSGYLTKQPPETVIFDGLE